jgi:hypothetical protein
VVFFNSIAGTIGSGLDGMSYSGGYHQAPLGHEDGSWRTQAFSPICALAQPQPNLGFDPNDPCGQICNPGEQFSAEECDDCLQSQPQLQPQEPASPPCVNCLSIAGLPSWDSGDLRSTGNPAGAAFTLYTLPQTIFTDDDDGARAYSALCKSYGLQGVGCYAGSMNHAIRGSELTEFDPPGLQMPREFGSSGLYGLGQSTGWGDLVFFDQYGILGNRTAEIQGAATENEKQHKQWYSYPGIDLLGLRSCSGAMCSGSPVTGVPLSPVCALAH